MVDSRWAKTNEVALIELAGSLALLLYLLVAPGAAALRWLRFESDSRADVVLACVAVSLATVSLAVTLLLMAHSYTRPAAVLLLVLPAAVLVLQRRWRSALSRRPADTPPPSSPIASSTAEGRDSSAERAVRAIVIAYVAVYFLDAVTSPVSWWDGMVSWGKWAADWGRRTDSAHYVTGGYLQLLPRFLSVLYKVTGTHSDVLPVQTFAIHGFHVALAGILLVAAWRLAALLHIPSWPILVAIAGSAHFREHIGSGTVDLLLTAAVMSVVALYLAWLQGAWRARYEATVMSAAMFVCVFTKATGILGVLFVCALAIAAYRGVRWQVRRDRRAIARFTTGAVFFGLMAVAPFVLEQAYREWRLDVAALDPQEWNQSLRTKGKVLTADMELVYDDPSPTARAAVSLLRFWNNYGVPAPLRWPMTAFVAVCLLLMPVHRPGWILLPVAAAFVLFWLFRLSYDQRNLMPVVPVAAALIGVGADRLVALRPRWLWREGASLLVGCFLIVAGIGLLEELRLRAISPAEIGRRLRAMSAPTATKVQTFFPEYRLEYSIAEAIARRTQSRHVYASSPFYRFFPNGANTLTYTPFLEAGDGDLFCGHDQYRPPADRRWVFVAQGTKHRVWLRHDGLTDIAAHAWQRHTRMRDGTANSAAQPETKYLYPAASRNVHAGDFTVWQVSVGAPVAADTLRATYEIEDESIVDPEATWTACGREQPGGSVVTCGGIVSLRRGRGAVLRPGMLRVGIVAPQEDLHITRFSVTTRAGL